MSGSIYGKFFTVSTFGESHGPAVGVVVDGVTPGIDLSEADIQLELNRRRPGQSNITTPRDEKDLVQIMSGVFEGKTTGTPIMMLVLNQDQRSHDYSNIQDLFRPGHADYTYFKKYGLRDYRGGGRSSGRETIGRVAAGAIARKLLLVKYGIRITAFTSQVGEIAGQAVNYEFIEQNPARAADPKVAQAMCQLIEKVEKVGESVGGIVACHVSGVPAGIGEPVFDKLDAELAKAIVSIGGIKGIEFGRGFEAAKMYGTQHNDPIMHDGFVTNNAGGILGGISNGAEIMFRAAVKPTSSIVRKQRTIDIHGDAAVCETHGRHDPCLCPRIVPVVEAMTALVLIDLIKQNAALMA